MASAAEGIVTASFAGPWHSVGPPPREVRTGEFLTMHTVAELEDLVAATLYESDQLNQAAGACTAWLRADPRGFGDWSGRLSLHSRKLAHLIATAEDAIRATPQFERAITPAPGSTYEDFIAWRKDFAALDRELRTGGHGCAAPDYKDMPQPKATDADLNILHGAQAVTKPVDQAAAAAASAAASAGAFASSATPWLVVGAVAGVALVLSLRR
jgi:hypothetical protein